MIKINNRIIREYSYRDVERILKNNGYSKARTGKGDHQIFTNGIHNIPIPKKSTVNRMLFRRMIKTYDLKLDI